MNHVSSSQKRKLQKNIAHLTQPEMYEKSDGKRRRSRPLLLRPPRPSPPRPPPDWACRPRPAEKIGTMSPVMQLCRVVQLNYTPEIEILCMLFDT